MLKVKKNNLVRIHYRLTKSNGDLVDTSGDGRPLEFTCGRGEVVTGLERELIGMVPGQRKDFVIPPEMAYGGHDPSLVKRLPRAGFPSDRKLEVGQCFSYRSKQGAELRYRVLAVSRDMITADFNHPLAGEEIHCEVEVIDVTEE